jgi:ligand-binding sensor domain-containing protein/signal transduction histidine kinase/CheY-like chemotaxis protein
MKYFTALKLIILITSVLLSSASGQEEEIQKQLKFRHITIDNGLSANLVTSICQDSYGYIWVATLYGLNKYNGIEFKVYRHQNDVPNSLPSNFVYKVFCDSYGKLWIGTREGLCYYDESINGFIKVNAEDTGISKTVNDIKEDKNSQLWIASYQGLINYSLEKKLVSEIYAKDTEQIRLPSDSVYCLMIESNGNIWFSCYESGLCHLDARNRKLEYFRKNTSIPNSLPGNQINSIYEDASGRIWIGTYNSGTCYFNPKDSSFTSFVIDESNDYTSRVRTHFEDAGDNLFFGTRGGLYLFNPESNKFSLYADSKHKFSNLTNSSIMCSYKDRNNGLWIGTHYGGINYADMERKPFAHYSEYENNNHFLNSSSVFAFAKDRGLLYIGTENGLNIFNERTSTFKYLVHDPEDDNSISYNDIKSIAIDRKGNLWIGTNLGGLNYYMPKTGKFIHYRHKPGDSTGILSDKIYRVFVDSRDNLWLLSNRDRYEKPSTLSLLRKGSKEFIHFERNFYMSIYENSQGDFRIGGINGFWLYEYDNEKLTFIGNDSLIGSVYSIYEDTKGNIWAGSDKGLVKYNMKEKEWNSYSYEKGYPFSTVLGILEDSHMNIWISTNNGLIKMIKAVLLTQNINYRLYDTKDGIQSREFNYNAYFKSSDGEFYFGGINGFNSFYPERIRDDMHKPSIVISDLLINNQSVPVGSEFNGRKILKESISKTGRIKLRNKDKVFTIKFDALHFSNPEQNKYKYMLQGFDGDYSTVSAYHNFITYTDLPSGEYTFKVYAINYDGILSDEPAELDIIILPLLWQTWAFRIMVILLLFTAPWVYTFYRSENLRKQKRILERAVKERTEELEISNTELKQQQKEIIEQNKEIQSQKGEIQVQHDEIQRKNEQLEQSYEKIKILSDFGQKLTATLNLEAINDMIYNYVNSLIDTSVFGIGVYNDATDSIFFSRLMENGVPIPEFGSSIEDTTSCAAWCLKNQKVIMSNDFENEYKNFITEMMIRSSSIPKSLMYLPLTVMDKKIGILTVQSYHKGAYTEKDLQTLQSLASYIAIALDNAAAYDIVKSQNIELAQHRNELESLVQDRTKDLEKAKERAEESDKLKSAFLANMSHEIRTPLNAIIGFINLLDEDQVPEDDKAEFYHIIQSNGFSLLNLINDIIDFSKIEAGQLDISFSELNLGELLNEINLIYDEELRRIEKNQKGKLKIKMSKSFLDKVPVLFTDHVRLKQIFSNLINNAIKFTREGTIEYGIRDLMKDKNITFYVKDTGIGIDRKNYEIIFDRFRKIEDDKITLFRGAGLGLSITKYLVEKLGGEIWLESEVGKGTEFFFKLPLKMEEKPAGKKVLTMTSSGLTIPDWKEREVLVVEDEISNFMVVESMLKKTKIEVNWAKNGEEAIDIFKKNSQKIDIILMDIKLPKMDGFEAAKEIKMINSDMPVIALTAYALPKEEHLIRKEGFIDYLAKPIIRDKLIRVMSQYMK